MSNLLEKCLDVQNEFNLAGVTLPILKTFYHQREFNLDENEAVEWTRNFYKYSNLGDIKYG